MSAVTFEIIPTLNFFGAGKSKNLLHCEEKLQIITTKEHEKKT